MIWFLLTILVLVFGFVVMFGAPFLPTQKQQVDVAMDLLKPKKGSTLLELGCGDGRVLKAAARRGAKSVGYELNPLLVMTAKINTWKYRELVDVRWGNYWTAKWPRADLIYVFLLDKYMHKLDKKIRAHKADYGLKRVDLASYTFKVPGRKQTKEKLGVFLYEYK